MTGRVALVEANDDAGEGQLDNYIPCDSTLSIMSAPRLASRISARSNIAPCLVVLGHTSTKGKARAITNRVSR